MSEIQPIETIVRPLVTPEKAKQEWEIFEKLKANLLVEDDYQEIQNKRYIKRSGFRKIAVYFGLSDKILQQERVNREDKSFTWRIVVEAVAPNGRTSIGVGMCDSAERNFAHKEHDVYATAHTRAKSRAISDMVAGGAVSAEEMDGEPEKHNIPERRGVRYAVDRDGILLKLKDEGLDSSLVNVYSERGVIIVQPNAEIGPDWKRFQASLVPLGAEWILQGPESHWEIKTQ